MKIVTEFPHRVRHVEHAWILLSDGCRLAARMWLPENADRVPVPAILEYIPYRKRDRTRERDEPIHHYFAGHGYAAVRVDVRGTGDSDGVLLDEYHEQELRDGVEVLRWLAVQPWCSGSVGMIGKSWGGFNALQIAARRPAELKAVISVCASDDRYADDAHYMGGSLLNENLRWGSVLFTLSALPPDPDLVGDRWREQWLERLENSALFPERWMRHPRRDAYWKHGSVCESYADIDCAVYAVGGWADAYSNAVPRLLAGLRCPKKGLVGPWAHVYPHTGVPGPAIGFLQEALRWWDRWLKGIDNGVMDEPAYRAWMQESAPREGDPDPRSGRWVAEPSWPSSNVRPKKLFFGAGALVDRRPDAGGDDAFVVRSPQTTGLDAGSWCPFGSDGDLPRDQRSDDARSVSFDSDTLQDAHEILGPPVVELRLVSDRTLAMAAVRLNDVAPDGSSTRVSYGLLNLAHRESHEHPSPLEPGRVYTVRIAMNDIAHRFLPGHRIRLALSSTYWPIAWPPPEPVTLTVHSRGSHLTLPLRHPRAADASLAPFAPPEMGPEADTVDLDRHLTTRSTSADTSSNAVVITVASGLREDGEPAISRINPLELDYGHGMHEQFRITEHDPLSACGEIHHTAVSRRGGWNVRVETRVTLRSTQKQFELDASLEAFEGETRLFSKRWKSTVPRDLT